LNWSVNGVAGGSSALGQICEVSSNPCQPVTGGNALQVDYVAPGAIPQSNPVSVMATSAADSTKNASAQITVINHVPVSVQPASVTLAPLAVQGFAVTVLGTSNQSVVWQIEGTACVAAGICGAAGLVSKSERHTQYRLSSRPNPSGQSTIAAVIATRSDRHFWCARSGRG
jgi:hypothetical protein